MLILQGGDFWNLLLTACLEDLGTEPAGEDEDSNFVAYSCCFQDPDLLMAVTSQLTHLIFKSNLDRLDSGGDIQCCIDWDKLY